MAYTIKGKRVQYTTQYVETEFSISDIVTGSITKRLDEPSSFTFALAPGHPQRPNIEICKTYIEVSFDTTILFYGRVRSADTDVNGITTYTCDGCMAFYADRIATSFALDTRSDVGIYMTNYLFRETQISAVRVQFVTHGTMDFNAIGKRDITAYDAIQQFIIGGEKVSTNTVYHWCEDGGNVHLTTWLNDPTKAQAQHVSFRDNLISVSRSVDGGDVCSHIRVLYTNTSGSASSTVVNRMNDLHIGYPAYKEIKIEEQMSEADAKQQGYREFDKYNRNETTYDVTAFDLGILGQAQFFNMYQPVVVELNDTESVVLPIREITYNLTDPTQDTITLGGEVPTLTRMM